MDWAVQKYWWYQNTGGMVVPKGDTMQQQTHFCRRAMSDPGGIKMPAQTTWTGRYHKMLVESKY